MTSQDVEDEFQNVLADHRDLLRAVGEGVRITTPFRSDEEFARLSAVLVDATVLRLVATTERLLRDFLSFRGAAITRSPNLTTLADASLAALKRGRGPRATVSVERDLRRRIEPYREWRNDYGHGVVSRPTVDPATAKRDLARFVKALL